MSINGDIYNIDQSLSGIGVDNLTLTKLTTDTLTCKKYTLLNDTRITNFSLFVVDSDVFNSSVEISVPLNIYNTTTFTSGSTYNATSTLNFLNGCVITYEYYSHIYFNGFSIFGSLSNSTYQSGSTTTFDSGSTLNLNGTITPNDGVTTTWSKLLTLATAATTTAATAQTTATAAGASAATANATATAAGTAATAAQTTATAAATSATNAQSSATNANSRCTQLEANTQNLTATSSQSTFRNDVNFKTGSSVGVVSISASSTAANRNLTANCNFVVNATNGTTNVINVVPDSATATFTSSFQNNGNFKIYDSAGTTSYFEFIPNSYFALRTSLLFRVNSSIGSKASIVVTDPYGTTATNNGLTTLSSKDYTFNSYTNGSGAITAGNIPKLLLTETDTTLVGDTIYFKEVNQKSVSGSAINQYNAVRFQVSNPSNLLYGGSVNISGKVIVNNVSQEDLSVITTTYTIPNGVPPSSYAVKTYLVDMTNGALTLTLPSASTYSNGAMINVRKITTGASNTLTISCPSGTTILSSSQLILSTSTASITCASDAVNSYRFVCYGNYWISMYPDFNSSLDPFNQLG